MCGITRKITVRDPLTGGEKQVRICDVASSHMARRTFIGNLYKKVKDPNLIASMSGYTEGSQAFTRYREAVWTSSRTSSRGWNDRKLFGYYATITSAQIPVALQKMMIAWKAP